MTPAARRQYLSHELRMSLALADAHERHALDLADARYPGAHALCRELQQLASHHRRRAARLADELAALETP